MFDRSPENGAAATRASKFLKSTVLWTYFAAYFPLTLHKTVELEPTWVVKNASPLSTGRPVRRRKTIEESNADPLDSDSSDVTIANGLGPTEEADVATETDLSDNESPHGPSDYNIIQSSTSFEHPELMGTFGIRLFLKELFFWVLSFLPFPTRNTEPEYERKGRQYIFGYHPHGIIGMGAIGGIATEGANWSKMFPGIRVSTLTLVNQFQVPFYREYLLALGLASVSRRSCGALLDKGQSICIVLGGAQESLLARPGYMDLVLTKRKGFVKLAMAAGRTSLVPVLGFGENDLYDQVKNDPSSYLYRIQNLLKEKIGFTLPLMHARGIFNYDFGIIPYRRPINIVVGRPIDIPLIERPTEAQVAHYHGLYVEELTKLFEAHKDKFHKDLTGKFEDCVYHDLRVVA